MGGVGGPGVIVSGTKEVVLTVVNAVIPTALADMQRLWFVVFRLFVLEKIHSHALLGGIVALHGVQAGDIVLRTRASYFRYHLQQVHGFLCDVIVGVISLVRVLEKSHARVFHDQRCRLGNGGERTDPTTRPGKRSTWKYSYGIIIVKKRTLLMHYDNRDYSFSSPPY